MDNEPRSLPQAREWVRSRLDEGVECPCCSQYAKIYERKIHFNMARALIIFYKRARVDGMDNFLSLNEVFADQGEHVVRLRGDFPKLKHWGLIVEAGNDDPEKKTSGCWKLTQNGVKFVENRTKVMSCARIFNDRLLGMSGSFVSIKDCLGQKFSYLDLMGWEFCGREPQETVSQQCEIF